MLFRVFISKTLLAYYNILIWLDKMILIADCICSMNYNCGYLLALKLDFSYHNYMKQVEKRFQAHKVQIQNDRKINHTKYTNRQGYCYELIINQ